MLTILDLDVKTVNDMLGALGFNAIAKLKRIIKLETLPLLGSGKIDYQKLKEIAKQEY